MAKRDLLWKFLSKNSDALPVDLARRACYRALYYLHAENHDMSTNGERWLVERLQHQLTTVFDVGANRGTWTEMVLASRPDATVHCFELDSNTRKILADRLQSVRSVTVAPSGLLDLTGRANVKQYLADSSLNSIIDFPHDLSSKWTQENVTTGDEYVQRNRISRIDLLKIDAEGSDFRVLRGFDSTLSRQEVAVVQFEYGYGAILGGGLLTTTAAYLAAHGFQVGRLTRKGVDFRPIEIVSERFFGPNYVGVLRSRPDLVELLRCTTWAKVSRRRRHGRQRDAFWRRHKRPSS